MAVQKGDIAWKILAVASTQVCFTMALGAALRAVYTCACFQAKPE